MKRRRPPKRNDGPKAAATHEAPTAKSESPDVLGDLSKWLKNQWLRHYILFSGLANEADRLAMVRLAGFLDALKGVRK
jgi:hypothetical protein